MVVGAGAGDTAEQVDAEGTAQLEQFLQHVFGVDATPAIHQIKAAFQDVNAEVAKKFAEHKAASAAAAGGAKASNPRNGGGIGCPMRGGGGGKKASGAGCGRRAARQHGGWYHHVANAPVPLGDRLPAGPLGFRTFGPGVAQLQIALIKAGVLDESAIRMHTGKYGPRTAEAVYSLQEKYSLAGSEPGVFDDKVAAIVLDMIDGSLAEPAPAPATTPEQEQEQEEQEKEHESALPCKWQAELDVLAGMGFTDEAVLTPLIEKHNGSIIFVMTELLG